MIEYGCPFEEAFMKESNKKKMIYVLLAAVAVIWGFGFVFMKQVYAYISPAMLNICRFAISAAVMFPVFFKKIIKLNKKQWLNGVFAGFFMALGFGLQAYGMRITSAGNSALLTGLNVVMVPFFAWIFYKKRPPIKSFAAAIIAFSGIAFLGFGGFARLNFGDLLCFFAAIAFAMHFIILDKITKNADSSALAFVQMLTCTVIFLFIGLVFDMEDLKACTYDNSLLFPMFSLCVLSTGFAYYVQSMAQTIVPPSKVSLILSCESVLGAIFAVLVGQDSFTWYLGVAVAGMAVALFVSEADFKRKQPLPSPPPEGENKNGKIDPYAAEQPVLLPLTDKKEQPLITKTHDDEEKTPSETADTPKTDEKKDDIR